MNKKSTSKNTCKVGDEIILKKSYHGLQPYEGQIFIVHHVYASGNPRINVRAKNVDLLGQNIYSIYSDDTWVLADRNAQKEVIIKNIADKKKDLAKLEEELEFLEKYPDEESFVADKLNNILETYDKVKSKEKRVKAMAEILKTLKESHML